MRIGGFISHEFLFLQDKDKPAALNLAPSITGASEITTSHYDVMPPPGHGFRHYQQLDQVYAFFNNQ